MPSRPVRPPSSTITSPGAGRLAAHMVGRRGGNDRADLHALGHVAGVVHLVDLAGGQTDLVAVGWNSRRRRVVTSLRWGSLPGSVSDTGAGRVGGAGDAHGLIHVAAARTGDRGWQPPRQVAAPPNGSISVGWLWVSFLNRNSQSCVLAVDVHLDLDGAGVDLLGLVQAGEHALAS